MSWALVADELRRLQADLVFERRKARWAPYKGDPERQCTATSKQTKKRCKAPRLKRPDGSLAPTCRMHGGCLGSLESQERVLSKLVLVLEARLKGAKTKLALVRQAIDGARDMTAVPGYQLLSADSSEAANYPGPIEDGQQYQALSDGRQSEGQTLELGSSAAGCDKGGPTER